MVATVDSRNRGMDLFTSFLEMTPILPSVKLIDRKTEPSKFTKIELCHGLTILSQDTFGTGARNICHAVQSIISHCK